MHPVTRRTMLRTAPLLAGLLAAPAVRAQGGKGPEKLTYLFPAPDTLPAFAPFQIARHKGYYREAGLEPVFQTGRGGADVAKQVAVGNAELGGGIGDTPLVVRPNGLAVRGVALLGNRPLSQIIVRQDSGITDIHGLRGKNIGVIAFQDTTYYNLLAVMASAGMRRTDANIQALGPAGLVQLMGSGGIVAMSGVPEWAVTVERAGVPVNVMAIDRIFPAMAQAILASDRIIAERPAVVRGFVQATLRAVKEIAADPVAAARTYVEAVPSQAENLAANEEILRRYATLIYAVNDRPDFGSFDPARIAAVGRFYLEHGIVQKAVPVEDTYTNEFVAK
ncbi:ABC transporter substrate-binding protein [Roseomonas mucosa]|uniref:ABC transporter substrate-binding protein n=1 Tax=Roseomonas mucosa TaxID=207340 RepID=UPI00220D689F|nr:ABC transporter substrate-binding protein [Roseomonas mucosa]QDJ08210.1 ABC transporter substrate-binding protein [Roseomonas mucosa]